MFGLHFYELMFCCIVHADGSAGCTSRDPDVGKKEKLDAGLDDYWGKEDAAMEEGAAK